MINSFKIKKFIKKDLTFWVSLTSTLVLAVVTIVTSQILQGKINISPFNPESKPYAWDCAGYTFSVDTAGRVKVYNGSARNETPQNALVYINDILVATLSVPALLSGQEAILGTVLVPTGGFSWRVNGSVDCSNSFVYKACALSYSIPRPTLTPTPRPTSTPTPRPTSTPIPTLTSTPTPSSVCRVSYDIGDTAVCWHQPKSQTPVSYTIHSLPSSGGPYYLQTDWYVSSPTPGQHHYTVLGPVSSGQKGTVHADWPGVPVGETGTVEIHLGLNIVNSAGTPVQPNCSGGMDYYWTPFVCPAPTPTSNASSPTPGAIANIVSSEDTYVSSSSVGTNYGNATTIQSDGSPKKIGYLKFDLAPLAGKTLTSVKLRLRVTNSSLGTKSIKTTPLTWNENSMTYNNRPTLGSTIQTIGSSLFGGYKEVDVTNHINANKGQIIGLAIDMAGSDGLDFYSSEYSTTSYRPTLIIR